MRGKVKTVRIGVLDEVCESGASVWRFLEDKRGEKRDEQSSRGMKPRRVSRRLTEREKGRSVSNV